MLGDIFHLKNFDFPILEEKWEFFCPPSFCILLSTDFPGSLVKGMCPCYFRHLKGALPVTVTGLTHTPLLLANTQKISSCIAKLTGSLVIDFQGHKTKPKEKKLPPTVFLLKGSIAMANYTDRQD